MSFKISKEEILTNKVFKETNIENMLEEIYGAIKNDDNTIQQSLENVTRMILNLQNDQEQQVDISEVFGFVGPIIKDFIEASNKNKKNMIDFAKVVNDIYGHYYRTVASMKESENEESMFDELAKFMEQDAKKELELVKKNENEIMKGLS